MEIPDILRPHPSHIPTLSRTGIMLGVLISIMILAWVFPTPASLRGFASYLPLHTLLETIAVVIAMLIFAVGWNSHFAIPRPLVVISCLFFSVGLLDFSHFLSYAGMPAFVTPSGPEKAINFWLAARLTATFGLLLALFLPWRPFASTATRWLILAAALISTLFFYWLFLFNPDAVPRTFIPGKGLTDFKVAFEYFLIALSLLTACLLWLRMRKLLPYDAALIFGAVCIIAMSEFFFTLYADVTDVFNLLGHLYKVLAYLLLYHALVVEAIKKPYHDLDELQQRLTLSLSSSNTGLWSWDLRENILYFSPEWKRQLGYGDNELTNTFATWESRLHPEDHDRAMETLDRFLKSRETVYENEFRLRHQDGTYRWIMARGEARLDQHGHPISIQGSHIDITQRKHSEEAIHNLAFFDPLTQLPNRRLFMDRVQLALLFSARSKSCGALMFIDLDHFKLVNDSIGHSFGDILLIEVSKRIRDSVREEDTVARLGGDEFVVLIENIDSDPTTASKRAAVVAEKLHSSLTLPYKVSEFTNYTSASIGVTIFSGTGLSVDDLLKQADLAMYQAKEQGRNKIRFFDPTMQRALESQVMLERDMRNALEQGHFKLYYQMQVNSMGSVIGAEALLRWVHPAKGMIPPNDFIRSAEETMLIVDIGKWALETACQQLLQWGKSEQTKQMNISVNVSAVQFRMQGFVDQVASIIKRSGVNPALLKLELTESTVLEDVDDIINKMYQLKALGLQISMDDFGTGYSSLSYLTRLPLDQLKIDQSFVRNINIDRNDTLMVQTIIHMTRNLGLQIIAEGVETVEQKKFLEENGCLQFQGYLFSKPLPIEELEKRLANR